MSLKSACGSYVNGIKGMRNRILNIFDSPILVLIYHRVATLPSDPHQLAVSPENFLNHMMYIKNNFPVLRFEDTWSNIKELSIVITFDDGYADNIRSALPILEKVGVPATFFISTGYLGSQREFWWDDLERILLQERVLPSTFTFHDAMYGNTWPTESYPERHNLYQNFHQLVRKVDAARRADWFRQLRVWADLGEEGRTSHRIMTIHELQELASSNLVTIGAHTVSHTPLAVLPYDQQQQEIFESKRQLEELTGRNISVFSYPFGGKGDYTPESVQLCRKAGYIRSASNYPGQVHRWTDSHQIPRNLVRNWQQDIFQRTIQEFCYR